MLIVYEIKAKKRFFGKKINFFKVIVIVVFAEMFGDKAKNDFWGK